MLSGNLQIEHDDATDELDKVTSERSEIRHIINRSHSVNFFSDLLFGFTDKLFTV